MGPVYCFDDWTEHLMIANDPRVTQLRVEQCNPSLPNLAARLGHALHQTRNIMLLCLDLRCFDGEADESMLLPIIQWVATSATPMSITISSFQNPGHGRIFILHRWFQQALCNRRLLSLSPLKELSLFNGAIYADTLVGILKACRPEILTLCSSILTGSLASHDEAVEHVRGAFFENASLRQLTLSSATEMADFFCAILESLPGSVNLRKLHFHAANIDGQTVVPPLIARAVTARLERHPHSLRRADFYGFAWTASRLSTVMAWLRPFNLTGVSFASCTFDIASSHELLSLFGDTYTSLPNELTIFHDVSFPGNVPVLEHLLSSPALSRLSFCMDLSLHMDGMLAGLAAKTSIAPNLFLDRVCPADCRRLLDAIPSFGKLQRLTMLATDTSTQLRKELIKAAKRNGSIKEYSVNWSTITDDDRTTLGHYCKRNGQLYGALAAVAAGSSRDKLPVLPSLLRAAVEATSTAASITHILAPLLCCGMRIGLDRLQPTSGCCAFDASKNLAAHGSLKDDTTDCTSNGEKTGIANLFQRKFLAYDQYTDRLQVAKALRHRITRC